MSVNVSIGDIAASVIDNFREVNDLGFVYSSIPVFNTSLKLDFECMRTQPWEVDTDHPEYDNVVGMAEGVKINLLRGSEFVAQIYHKFEVNDYEEIKKKINILVFNNIEEAKR